MSKKIIRIISIFLVAVALLSSVAFAFEGRASDYINSTYATISPKGNGVFKVEFRIVATGQMSSIGATEIKIYHTGHGLVETYCYTDSDYSYLMSSGTGRYSNTVQYDGISGESYYAIVEFYAGNSTGHDETSYVTSSRVV